jgi:hypothetical protein
LYDTPQSSIEDKGGYVLPDNVIIKEGEDYYKIREREQIRIHVIIKSECGNQIKVRSYFSTIFSGNHIKGGFTFLEFIQMQNGLIDPIDAIKKVASREANEETGIELTFDKKIKDACYISVNDLKIRCKYSIESTHNKEQRKFNDYVNIKISCNDYTKLKKEMKKNKTLLKKMMESKCEVSSIIIE